MHNTRRLRNSLLSVAVTCTVVALSNMLVFHLPHLTTGSALPGFLLFLLTALLDRGAARRNRSV